MSDKVKRVEHDGEVTMINLDNGASRTELVDVADWFESLPIDLLDK
ncbi:hypothetical protein [Actinocrispum wychmicini]|uniref:Uncharacterized protein n=1 Tax=Actinocrispum wychmicini TaxID=1213861 RepID=A0A4R2JZY8_9PSEU|nr:hypothetical protein [Actinocrispum wychmicini]TCO64937.1 hypothetical protein EV192_101721 [Actinocrispum wychmicini]